MTNVLMSQLFSDNEATIIVIYYKAGSASGQDEPNHMGLSYSLGIARFGPRTKNCSKPAYIVTK